MKLTRKAFIKTLAASPLIALGLKAKVEPKPIKSLGKAINKQHEPKRTGHWFDEPKPMAEQAFAKNMNEYFESRVEHYSTSFGEIRFIRSPSSFVKDR